MRPIRRYAPALIAAVAAATVGGFGQTQQAPDRDAPQTVRPTWTGRSPQAEELLRKLLGMLTYSPVSVSYDRTPAREAFDALRSTLDIPLIGRYRDDTFGYGLDPEAPITLQAADRPAIEVLEEMLEQCSRPGEPCTWQMRTGFVEFGTKARLSVPAARETRFYYVADLIVDIPENVRQRTRREVYAVKVVQKICEKVEPGQWDYGQDLEPPDLEDYVPSPKAQTGEAADRGGGRQISPGARPAATQRRYVPPPKVAIIRYWRDIVIIHAPDYIHRQINGYPEPIRPTEGP